MDQVGCDTRPQPLLAMVLCLVLATVTTVISLGLRTSTKASDSFSTRPARIGEDRRQGHLSHAALNLVFFLPLEAHAPRMAATHHVGKLQVTN